MHKEQYAQYGFEHLLIAFLIFLNKQNALEGVIKNRISDYGNQFLPLYFFHIQPNV